MPNQCINSERGTRAVGALTYSIIQRASANVSVVSRQVVHTLDVVGKKNVSDILIIVEFRNQMAGNTDHTE